ncbi:gem-associated protein 6-like [Ornithodoros turicata]
MPCPESEKQDDEIHNVFKNDPVLFLSYVHKLVRVETTDKNVYAGYVKTIDPVSESVILVLFENDKPKTLRVIMGHCVKSITVVEEATSEQRQQLENLFVPHCEQLSTEQIKERRDKLLSWLRINRLPVKQDPENTNQLVIADSVIISPPYTAVDCQCTNEIVLGKVCGLISSMPADIETWNDLYQ